jgi:choline dehydrogenase-like flavoprotein
LIKFSKNAVITVPDGLIGPPLYQNGETVPQKNADNRELIWAIAIPEGGASSVNAGAYCRGTTELYARWEAIAGKHWSVKRIFSIYKTLEKYRGYTNNPKSRGYCGLLNVFQNPNPTRVSLTFTQALINATGFPFVLDYNDPTTPIGASSELQYTQKGPDGLLRVSSVNAFLNDKVVTPDGEGVGCRKLRLLFDAIALNTIWQGNRAIGVRCLVNGKPKKIYARKGVIVCAGLKSSPFLLHSGVGPKSLLRSLGIPVKFDNPNVGQGLADQPAIRLVFTSNPADTPDIQQNGLFAEIAWLPAPGGDSTIRELRFATINQVPGVTIGTFDLCQPKSQGSVSINSSDPLQPPIIDLGIFNDPSDLTLFLNGFQTYISALNTNLQAIDPAYALIFPNPAILNDPALLTAFIKENVSSNQHFQCHCRMAPLSQGGVVDCRGRVYGVKNLYVADNSINPLGMDGSPMATAYLCGYNVAQMIIDCN